MTTAAATVAQQVSTLSEAEAKTLLQKVLEQTEGRSLEIEKLRGQLERERTEQQRMAEVKFGPDGLESSNLASLWRVAQLYSRADILPEQYRGKPENCLIALQMAARLRVDAFAFMQSSYIVYGKPGVEGKLAIAMLNASGKIKGRVRFEFSGEGKTKACTAIVVDKDSGEEIRVSVDWATVEREGWHLPKGKSNQPSKWTTIPDQMFRYRSAVFLIRAHYPEVMMGISTLDEIEDVEDKPQPEREVKTNGKHESRTDALADRLGAAPVDGPISAEHVHDLDELARAAGKLAWRGFQGVFQVTKLEELTEARFAEARDWLTARLPQREPGDDSEADTEAASKALMAEIGKTSVSAKSI
jgi:RecT family protein